MTVEEFMQHPTIERWLEEISEGWEGPNGSSMSSDHIMGVRIGEASTNFAHSGLPANLHDYRYRLGRRLKLGPGHRKAADAAFRDECISFVVDALDGKTVIRLAIIRSWARFYALRAFGGRAFTSDSTTA